MSDAKKFRFVSPGIFLNEIDQSYLSAQPTVVGPVIIGRTEKGPGMIPVKVGTFSEFVNVFGNPIAGNGAVDDVWRDGNYTSPTYGAYAAQAYLRAGVGPVTFVRLMGTQHPAATANTGEAGWTTTKVYDTDKDANGGAYGLYVWPSGSDDTDGYQELTTGSLAAIWYMDSGSLPVLSGNTVDLGSDARPFEGPAIPIKSDSSGQFKVRVLRGQTSATATITVTDFNEIGTSNTITVTTTNLSTVTITGHGSTTSMADATGDSSNGLFASVTNNNTTATNIKTAFNTHDELTATVADAVVTITQNRTGASGNTAITLVDPGTDGMTKTDFAAGAGATAGLGGNGAAVNGEVLGNADTLPACGLLYYQAGIAVVSGSVFSDSDDGGILSGSNGSTVLGPTSTDDGFNFITGSTIAVTADAVRTRMYNMSYNNTTELNSTIYFCRANHNDFNYSSNPTYLSGSKLRVKTRAADAPVTYITTVGLYSADNELLAVAKLSEPLRKDPTNELTLRVRLDY
jgi:hypothetical protein